MQSSSESNPEQVRMSVLSHLGELRLRLRRAAIAFVLATIVCYPFRATLFRYLAEPLLSAWRTAELQGMVGRIVFTGLPEPFLVLLKADLVAACFLAAPFVFYQLWRFISPGLYGRERRWAAPFVIAAFLLFLGGGLFCYDVVLPKSCEFFLSAGQGAAEQIRSAMPKELGESMMRPMLSMDEYFSLSLTMLVVFGAVFELPLLLSILTLTGVVSPVSLWRWNRYAIVLFAIAGAVLTPGDLVVGQLLMAGALTVLYNISIAFSWLAQRTRNNHPA